MKWWKNILEICAFLIVCTITGLITANLIAKPIKLTQAEVDYYVKTAETIWYEGFDSVEFDDTICIEYHLKEKQIEVLPINGNKQSITVNFHEPESLVTINKTVVKFWGCVGFYGILFGSIIYGVICWLIFIVKQRKKSRR